MCAAVLISVCVIPAYAYTPMDCNISAEKAIVYSIDADRVVYDKNANQESSIASLTKMMTAICVLESGRPLSENVTITPEMIELIPYDSSTAGLAAGEVYTIDQLLYCLMLPSGNDAAIALALHISGSIDQFSALMESTAKKIGCTHSGFQNPHGIDELEHYSTAADLAKIVAYGIKSENFLKYFSSVKYELNIEGYSATLHHTNQMMNPESPYYDADIIGSKTGSTESAGLCLATYAKRGDFSYITVVLGCEYDEVNDVPNTYADTKTLLDTAFSNYGVCSLYSNGDIVGSLPVTDMLDGDSIPITVDKTVTVITDSDLTVEDFTYETDIVGEYIAPVAKGIKVGTLTYYDNNGEQVGKCDILTAAAAEKSDFKALTRSLSLVKWWQYLLILLGAVVIALIIILIVQYIKVSMRRAMNKKKRNRR